MSTQTVKNRQKNITDLFDESRDGITLQTILIYIYLFAMFGIYPVITTDQYFNITVTRYYFFMYTTIIHTSLSLIVFIAGEVMNFRRKAANINPDREKKFYKRPEFWMEAFMMANIFSFVVSIDRDMSGMGYKEGLGGRYMGMYTYIIIAVMFMVIGNGRQIHRSVLLFLWGSSFYAFVVAIGQHMGHDFMGYRDNIRHDLYDIYISTFGNINVFASFLTICIPVFACVFIFMKDKMYRLLALSILVMGGMTLMAANSDSGFMGVFVAYILIFFLAVKENRVNQFIKSVILVFFGIAVQVFINRFFLDYENKRGGVAGYLDNISVVAALAFLLGFISLIYHFVSKRYISKNKKINKKKLIAGMIITMATVFVLFVAVGIIMKLSVFKFDYKWGNYRGMIWHICGDIFKNASPVHKLFGYGNETLQILTRAGYYDIMIENTNKVYDNAHNEILQYLVTTGIAGAVAYIGLFVTGFVYILKNSNKNVMAYISLAAMTGYFFQGLVNVNQPITTPFFFLIMAMGISCIRYRKKQEVSGE